MTIGLTFTDSDHQWSELLVKSPPLSDLSVAEQIFSSYQECLDTTDNSPALDSKRLYIFRRVFRDTYMESVLLDKKKTTLEICQLTTFFGENYQALFTDIDEIIEAGYNKNWEFGAILLQLIIEKMVWRKRKLEKLVKLTPDGEGTLDFLEKSRLLSYRIVTTLNPFKSIDGTITEVALSIIKKITNFMSLEAHFTDVFSTFEQTFYYLCVLKNNKELRKNFTSLLQLFYRYKDTSERPELSADDFCRFLLEAKDPGSINKILGILHRIRRFIHPSFFTLPFDEGESTEHPQKTIPKIQFIMGECDKNDIAIAQRSLNIKLPRLYRRSVMPKITKSIEDNSKFSNKKKLQRYIQILLWLYQESETFDVFKQDSARITFKIKAITKEIEKKRKVHRIEESWSKLCRGKLSSKELDIIIKDLSLECTRLIAQTKLEDINPKLFEYDHALESEGRDQDESASYLSGSSLLSFRSYSSPSLVEDLSQSGGLESTWPQGTDLSFTPRAEAYLFSAKSSKAPDASPIDSSSFGITDVFNNLSNLTIYTIINTSSKNKGMTIIKNCIHLAKRCIENDKPNLHIAYTIAAALQTNAVDRLKPFFRELPSRFQEIYEGLTSLFTPLQGYANYRQFCRNSSKPIIPAFAIEVRDLTYLTESKGLEQNMLKKELCERYLKMQYFLKLTFPPTPYQSDCVATIKKPTELLEMAAPKKKIDFGVEEEFAPDEWDSLPISDKLYYVSVYKWRNTSSSPK